MSRWKVWLTSADADGERERVVGVFEEGVFVDADRVEEEVGLVGGEADGAFVADEVDFVAGGGEEDAELGGDDAAAADGGVADDADAEGGHEDAGGVSFTRRRGGAEARRRGGAEERRSGVGVSLECAGGFGEGGGGLDDGGVVRPEGGGVVAAGEETELAGAGELEVEVVAMGELAFVAGHEVLPAVEDGGDVDEDGGSETGFDGGSDGVEPKGVDDVGGEVAEGVESGVAGEAAGVAGGVTDGGVVGMLIRVGDGCEDEVGADFADEAGDGGGVLRRGGLVAVASEVEEAEVGVEEAGGGGASVSRWPGVP